MWKFLSNLILKNRIVIIILIAMLTVFMIKKGKEAKLSYSMAKLLPESHQVNIEYNNFMFAYTYSYQANSVVFNNGGYHQITLGYNFGCKKEKYDCNCPSVN